MFAGLLDGVTGEMAGLEVGRGWKRVEAGVPQPLPTEGRKDGEHSQDSPRTPGFPANGERFGDHKTHASLMGVWS